MKKIILKSITLRNFRGEKDRTTMFNDVVTSIMGDNGLGKSRHFDAFVWLLFGKDTKDRKDYNIKTIIDGKVVERIDTEVSAILNVDNEDISLKRTYAEKWRKPRGQAEEVFDGYENLLEWNGSPVKVGEFNQRINAIVDDSVFKMITNPYFFANMDWKVQRDVLFQLAGTISDDEIASTNAEYRALLDKLSGKSLLDFKREIAARKKRLKDELITIQPKIQQTYKLMPESVDFAAIQTQITELDNELSNIDKAISDKTSAIRRQYEGVQAKQKEINELKQQQQNILNDAKMLANETAFESNAARRDLQSNIKALVTEIAIDERSLVAITQEIDLAQQKLNHGKGKIAEMRKSWYHENAKEYDGSDNCSCCGQPLKPEQRENARKQFTEHKANTLAQITQKGKELSEIADEVEQFIIEREKVRDKASDGVDAKRNELYKLQQQLKQLAPVEESVVNADELPDYVSLSEEIANLEALLDANTERIDTEELQADKRAINEKRDALKSELKNRDLIASYTQQIAELEAHGKNVAQQIAEAEKEEFILQNFTKVRIEESERRINGLFNMVTFKLFDYTNEGNEIETCVPLVNGIPFGTANTAGQINAGLDIINVLAKFNGVSAPIFIDGRESVNELIHTESQIINLIVTQDKELIIK